MEITQNQKEELLNSPLFVTGKRLTLHPNKNEETWYDENHLPKQNQTTSIKYKKRVVEF